MTMSENLRSLLEEVDQTPDAPEQVRRMRWRAEQALHAHPATSDRTCAACSIPPVVIEWPCPLLREFEAQLRGSLDARLN